MSGGAPITLPPPGSSAGADTAALTLPRQANERLEFARLTIAEQEARRVTFGSTTLVFNGTFVGGVLQVAPAQPLELRFDAPRRLVWIELSEFAGKQATLTIGGARTKRQAALPLTDAASDVSAGVRDAHSRFAISSDAATFGVAAIEVEPPTVRASPIAQQTAAPTAAPGSPLVPAPADSVPMWAIGVAVGGAVLIVVAVVVIVVVSRKHRQASAVTRSDGAGDVRLSDVKPRAPTVGQYVSPHGESYQPLGLAPSSDYRPLDSAQGVAVVGTYNSVSASMHTGSFGGTYTTPSQANTMSEGDAESYLPLPI